MSIKRQFRELGKDKRVDNPDTSFQAVVKGAFASTTGKDLSFNDHVISSCAVSAEPLIC